MAASSPEGTIPTPAACATCRWLRVARGPTPSGNGPNHRCANLGGPHFAELVTDAFACGRYERGAGSFIADLGMDAPANDTA